MEGKKAARKIKPPATCHKSGWLWHHGHNPLTGLIGLLGELAMIGSQAIVVSG